MSAPRPLRLGLIAATFTGNRGAEAMLLATIDETRRRYPDAEIHVLTYAPAADAAWLARRPHTGVFLHASTPLTLAFRWFPGACLARLLPFLKAPLPARSGQGILRLLDLDAVVDLAGVSFMDRREKFLPFNVLTLFPFLLHGVPVVKLSQALGPIRSLPNRLCARWVLPRLAHLAARGRQTSAFLEEFGLGRQNWSYAPDTAFCLRLETEVPATFAEREDVLLMPSSLMAASHPDYPDLLLATLRRLRALGLRVHLLAHSWKEGTDRPRNNDFPLCRSLHAALGSPADMTLFGPGLDARALKAVVGRHRLAVTSRFHGMIAALDTATPVLVLGWSHKYREVLAEFDCESCALKTDGLDAAQLADTIAAAHAGAAESSARLALRLPEVRRQSAAQFDRLFSLLAVRRASAGAAVSSVSDS